MGEKKFLESIEDGELDIAVYARSWEEGDNVTVTCDLLFAMEQAVGVFNEQKAEIERLKKEKENWTDREKSFVNYFEKAKKEIAKARKKYDSRTTIDEFMSKFRREIERFYLKEVDILIKATMTKVAEEMKNQEEVNGGSEDAERI